MKDSESQCMCKGGPEYHKTVKVLSYLEEELGAALRYAQYYINDESENFDFRRLVFERLERLRSFKIQGPQR